jgi:hypothetical protein
VNLSWLPKPPDKDWHSASSYSNPAYVGVHGSCPHWATNHPDPDGIDHPPEYSCPRPPSSSTMGGALNRSHFSLLTLGSGFGMGGHVGMGDHAHGNHPGSVGGASNIIGSFCSVVSPVLHSVVPTSSDSSLLTSSPSPLMATTINGKLSDMGLKEITDKDSWMNAKKTIDARLHCAPLWLGPSKELVTTPTNAAASAWWEEVIVYYCKPPISDLFVEESRFDGKGFKMIVYIDAHFNLSRAVHSLGYIFDLINIRQSADESVVTLKACFSHLFASLKMGGILIDLALQVGFMLWALWSGYQAVIQEFCIGHHALTSATLQTVVNQCVFYDKDPWKGPVGCNGKPVRTPLANAAGSNVNPDTTNSYGALAAKLFNYHLNPWRKTLTENKGKRLLCHDSARNTDHKTLNCPILKKLRFKFEKRLEADNLACENSSCIETDVAGTSPSPAPHFPLQPLILWTFPAPPLFRVLHDLNQRGILQFR